MYYKRYRSKIGLIYKIDDLEKNALILYGLNDENILNKNLKIGKFE